jgi:hypothetical protein
MPRLNRIRIHNIHFDSGGQARYFHDTLFEPRGDNSLLLMANGGGKTLLLHLITQVVLPNVRLQERRITRLLEREKFTGHVLVEWQLDGDLPEYLLTGFCFAENLGSANREMDYFTYLHHYGGSEDAWNIREIALADEKDRNFNFKQLLDYLATGPVTTYASYRMKDYQRRLRQFNIEPREWEYVVRINNSEGGVEEFFEGCAKTRTLMNKLLIPVIDEVLERREKKDSLEEAFRKVAGQAIELPELRVQSEAVGALNQRIPALLTALDLVGRVTNEHATLVVKRRRLAATLFNEVAVLQKQERELRLGAEKLAEDRAAARFYLETCFVEEARREWVERCEAFEKSKVRLEQRRLALEKAQSYLNRFNAFKKIERIRDKESRLLTCEKRIELAGESEQPLLERLENHKKRALPLLDKLQKDLLKQIETLEGARIELQDELDALSGEKVRLEDEHCELGKQIYHLEQKKSEFEVKRAAVSRDFADMELNFDLQRPGVELKRLRGEREICAAVIAEGQVAAKRLLELKETRREQLLQVEVVLSSLEMEQAALQEQHKEWGDRTAELKAGLKALGYKGLFPAAEAEVLRYLAEKEKLNNEHVFECQRERLVLQDRRQLLTAYDYPRPNLDLGRAVDLLAKKQIPARLAAELLAGLSEAERRALLEKRPWLPYALVVENKHYAQFLENKLVLSEELEHAIPLMSREQFHLAGAPDGIAFISHRGLEIYYSAEKAASCLNRVESNLDNLSVKLARLEEEERKLLSLERDFRRIIDIYPYSIEHDWKKALKDKKTQVEEKREEAAFLNSELSSCTSKVLELEKKARRDQFDLDRFDRAIAVAEQFRAAWQENRKRGIELESLRRELETIDQRQAELETRSAELTDRKESLNEKINILRGRFRNYEEFSRRYFSAVELEAASSSTVSFSPPERGDSESLEEMMKEIASIHEALQGKATTLKDLYQQQEDLKNDIGSLAEDIRSLGFEHSEVAGQYYPVGEDLFREAKEKLTAVKAALNEADEESRNDELQVSSAESTHVERKKRLQKQDPERRIPDLGRVDLAAAKAEKEFNLKQNEMEQAKNRDLLTRCLDLYYDYSRALDRLEPVVSRVEREQAELFGESEAAKVLAAGAVRAVEESTEQLAKLNRDLDRVKNTAAAAMVSCSEELIRLHGDDVRRFFQTLEVRMNEADWEKRVDELRGRLNQAMVVIERLQEHIAEQLRNIDGRIDEIGERIWRHVDGLLDQFKELHRRAAVELGGEKLNLFKIEYTRPEEAQAKMVLKTYLRMMIEEGAKMHRSEAGRDDVDRFLNGAVASAQLLDQVVPLDSIRVRLLKPGDYESSYLIKHYDRWDHLQDWSQGQRFAGRFSLFVVLLSYLRQARSGGRKSSSVILADNPFGKASSGHILDIINKITSNQDVQLFCCTALRSTEILREFPVIYSLVFQPTMSGKERMHLQEGPGRNNSGFEQAHAYIPGTDNKGAGQLKLF